MMHAEMVHFIDLALWFNAPHHPVRIVAEGSPRGNFTILLRFSDGSLSTLQHTCDVESAVAVDRIILKVLEAVRLGLPVVANPGDWHVPRLE